LFLFTIPSIYPAEEGLACSLLEGNTSSRTWTAAGEKGEEGGGGGHLSVCFRDSFYIFAFGWAFAFACVRVCVCACPPPPNNSQHTS
jgi:hypothetical protein